MSKYHIYLCGDSPCPNDDRFEHRFYFGCVPKDFRDSTGRSKTHHQTETTIDGLPWTVFMWNGGCDASGETARRKLAENARATKRIRLL